MFTFARCAHDRRRARPTPRESLSVGCVRTPAAVTGNERRAGRATSDLPEPFFAFRDARPAGRGMGARHGHPGNTAPLGGDSHPGTLQKGLQDTDWAAALDPPLYPQG